MVDYQKIALLCGTGFLCFQLGAFLTLWSHGLPIELTTAHIPAIGFPLLMLFYGITGRPSFK